MQAKAALLIALTFLVPASAYAQDAGAWDGDAIARLQAEMKSGAITSRELVRMFLTRIETIDKHGPAINSVIELNPDALEIATQLDAERARSHKTHGTATTSHGCRPR